MKKILLILLVFSPIFLILGNTIYVNYKVKSPDNIIATGQCIETFQEEHWHKHSRPTVSTHTVVRNGHALYLIDGPCESARHIPWQSEHSYLYFFGQIGLILWGIVLFCIFASILYCWIILIISVFKAPKGKILETFLEELTDW